MVEGLIMDQAKWVTDSFIAFSAYNVTELLKPTRCIVLRTVIYDLSINI